MHTEDAMRTTVEIPDRQRAALLAIAAQRGQRGFSAVVEEALDLFLEAQARRDPVVRAALALRGCWSEAEAREARAEMAEARAGWESESRHG